MKSGIDYFPLDVRLDRKFELIEAEFGLKGFAVIVKLFQDIYGGEGYYIEFTTEVALLFSKKLELGCNVVSEIVSAAIARGIFDKEIYDKYQVLTSRGIQERYFEAISRRKEIKVKNEYLLLNCAQICKNANILSENVNISPENVNISKQSKVKESKVKKTKELSCSSEQSPDTQEEDLFSYFWKAYPKKSNRKDAEKAFRSVKDIAAKLPLILSDIEQRKASAQWQDQGGRFIPYPATYLRGERWNDEVSAPPQMKQQRQTDTQNFMAQLQAMYEG